MKKVVKNKRIIAIIAVVVLAVALFSSGVIAGPPAGAGDPPVASKINYQGQLTDDAGNPLDGTYDMEFQFWDSVSGGSQVGSTITKNNVQVNNGLFSVKLDVDQSDFNGQGLWLRMRVRPSGGSWDPWMTPRQEILPVPYALSLKPGAVITGSVSDDGVIHVDNAASDGRGVYGEASNTADVQNYGGYFTAAGSRGRGVYGKAANTGDEVNYGGFFYASGVQGRGVFGQSAGSSGYGVKGWASDEGLDVENYGGHFTSSGGSGIGVYGKTTSLGGIAVYGEAAHPYSFGLYTPNRLYAGEGISTDGRVDVGGVLMTGDSLHVGDILDAWDAARRVVVKGELYVSESPYGPSIIAEGDVRIQGGLTVDGSATGFFPRPAYDSGWVSISQGEDMTLVHQLGGNVDSYVVDLQFKKGSNVHHYAYGMDGFDTSWDGADYHMLNSTSIRVQRAPDDAWVEQVRVRIWVYK